MHLVCSAGGHGRTKISQLVFGLFLLIFHLANDAGHAVLNVNKEDLGKLLGQLVATKQVWWHSGVNWVRCEESLFFCNSILN